MELSWRTLTRKIWYPGYPAPAWVWQSTPAGDSFAADKYSLVPLVVGTLKAAACAMLFSTPLALAAAMYSAWFMSAGLRRWVKQAMEIMGAVPSVIVGVIAGLWLVPNLAAALGGIVLLPLIAFVLWGCFTLAPPLERLLFGMPLLQALGDNYNQLNALVVGIAMGFALIPLLLTLAEDALFGVPTRLVQGSLALGATPWQPLMGVTLPAASAGLVSAFMLTLGRAMGETMIVLMASGNLPRIDGSVLQGLRAGGQYRH